MEKSGRTTHNLAYLCFIPPIVISVISSVSKFIPMDSGTAGGIGFLLLIPIALVALISSPVGIILSFKYRKDYALIMLSLLTILYVVEIITETGSTSFYNMALSIYGVLGVVILASWFLFRTKSYYPAEPNSPSQEL